MQIEYKEEVVEPVFVPFTVTLKFESQKDIEEYKSNLGAPVPWESMQGHLSMLSPINRLTQAIKFRKILTK